MTGPQNLFRGMILALRGDADWRRHFNLRRDGLQWGLAAMIAMIPLYGIMIYAAQVNNDASSQINPALGVIFIAIYIFSFALFAYGTAFFLNQTDDFRPWLIVRSFIAVSLAAIMALLFVLFLIGILPFFIGYWAALVMFIALLLIDIRLAQTVLGQQWMSSVFIGIGVHITALLLLLGALASVAY